MLACALAASFLSATSLEGKTVDPSAFSTSKATVWVFVGTECPISNAYAPELRRLSKEFKGSESRFYFIYSDPSTRAKEALSHWSSFHLSAPGLLDTDQTLMRRAGATKTPEAAVFDSKGHLVYRGRIDDRWAKLGVGRSKAHERTLHDVLAQLISGHRSHFTNRPAVGCYIPTK